MTMPRSPDGAIGAAVLVKPCMHPGDALTKTADRDTEFDATREPTLGLDNHQL